MDTRAPVLDSGADARDVAARNRRPIKFVGGILGVVIMLLFLTLLTHSPRIDSNAAVSTAPHEARGGVATFFVDYFPAQFPTVDLPVEPHIQAF
jgi:hypothetical protein